MHKMVRIAPTADSTLEDWDRVSGINFEAWRFTLAGDVFSALPVFKDVFEKRPH